MFFEPNKVRVERKKTTKKYAVLILLASPSPCLPWLDTIYEGYLFLLLYDWYELGNYLLMRLL